MNTSRSRPVRARARLHPVAGALALIVSALVMHSGLAAVAVSIQPSQVGLTTSQVQTFSAAVTGTSNTAVTWAVDGIAGGNATSGTITATGTYTPPIAAGVHTISATSVADSTESASATAGITDLLGVLTQRYDAARTGENLSEYALTASVLATPGAFGKRFSCTISDGPITAQPLYVANLAIGGGTHNVLFVATQNNTIYAFDADASACTIYRTANLDPAGSVPTPNGGDQYDGDIRGPYGIYSTPVIDPVGGVLYAVASTFDNGSALNYRLHAVSLATGADQLTPVVIGATVSGVVFDPSVHLQRPALLLSGSSVFVSFGSYGDDWTYYGWVMGYDKTSLSQVAAFNSAPHSSEGTGAGIWMGGAGPAADSTGAIYFSTGNGPFNAANTLPPVAPHDNFGDTLLKLTGTLALADFFTPASQGNLDSNDLDFGSGGVMVLPDGAGSAAHPNLAIASDKESNLYVVDRGNLGRYNSAQNTNLRTVQVNGAGGTASTGIFGTASYWNGNVYIGAVSDNLKAYSLSSILATAYPGPSPSSQSQETFDYPGTNVAISAAGAGATSAVAWALDTSANGTDGASFGPAILRAYDATNLATTLWSSSAKGTDTAGNAVKFALPTVANGKVYVAGPTGVTVYGLLPTVNAGLIGTSVVGALAYATAPGVFPASPNYFVSQAPASGYGNSGGVTTEAISSSVIEYAAVSGGGRRSRIPARRASRRISLGRPSPSPRRLPQAPHGLPDSSPYSPMRASPDWCCRGSPTALPTAGCRRACPGAP